MTKVGFLNYDWSYSNTYAYCQGMKEYIRRHKDVEVFVFNAFGNYADDTLHPENLEVFHLLYPNRFDAVIIQGNRAWPVEYRQKMIRRIRSFGVPVVSINYPFVDTAYIGTNNYEAELTLIRKIFADRKIKRPFFINGTASSKEAQERARAYYKACIENHITSPGFYQGDWDKWAGTDAIQKLLTKSIVSEMPDAIFCCNDDIASGVIEGLKDTKYVVGKDIFVTGFDNTSFAKIYRPGLTTVDRNFQGIGYGAMELAVKMANGESVPEKNYSPVQYIYGGTCGYDDTVVNQKTSDYYVGLDATLKRYYSFEGRFQQALLSCDCMTALLKTVENIGDVFRVPNMYLMINEDYYTNYGTSYVARHYSDMQYICSYYGTSYAKLPDPSQHLYGVINTADLIPLEDTSNTGFHILYPLRVQEICIGYVVLDDVSEIMSNGFLSLILGLIASASEAIRARYMLEEMNSKLGDLYIHDPLTGLYNRFGLETEGKKVFDWYLEEKESVSVVFIDLDEMKGINDQYGHDHGDQAIKDTAELIKKGIEGEEAFAMRYGGDEFVIVGSKKIAQKIQQAVEDYRKKTNRPYDLSLSIGTAQVNRSDSISLYECIRNADDEMYERKRERKLTRTSFEIRE